MWMCPKCSKQALDGSRICRDCGAILEEVPDELPPESSLPAESYPSLEFVHESPPPEPEILREPEILPEHYLPGEEEPPADGSRYAQVLGLEPDEEMPPPRTECTRCGSTGMMQGLKVDDQGEDSSRHLRVILCRNRSGHRLEDLVFGELVADVCGNCGHVELQVNNARYMYQRYLTEKKPPQKKTLEWNPDLLY